MLRGADPQVVEVELVGGIGNQLFGYTAALYYSLYQSRPLRLNISNINQDFEAKGSTILSFCIPHEIEIYRNQGAFPNRLVKRIAAVNSAFSRTLKKRNLYKSECDAFDETMMSRPDISVLVGYFQTHEYYSKLLAAKAQMGLELKKTSANMDSFLVEAEKKKILSIHVRRGDYVKFNDVYVELGIDYYQAALLEVVNSGVFFDEIYVFSDDVRAAKNLLDGLVHSYQTTWIDEESGLSDTESLVLMTKMSVNIMANSTFSYWGALMNMQTALVVAPSQWFVDINHFPPTMPPEWRLVNMAQFLPSAD